MSLFDRFSRIISRVFPSKLDDREATLLSQLDPHKIYVENVRSLLDVSYKEALGILETAVRQGVFQKHIEVMCPDGTVAASADAEDAIPDRVQCWSEDDEGHLEEMEISTHSLKKVVFYSLDERSDSASYSSTTQVMGINRAR
jgi:hypothetical protein